MHLQAVEKEALELWLVHDTAMTSHPLDQSRFYHFVATVWRERKALVDCRYLKDEIGAVCLRIHPEWNYDSVEEFVKQRMDQATLILDFLASLREHQNLHLLS